MLNLGFSEICLIFLVGLVVFGPDKLPELARFVGKTYRELRRASAELNYHMRQTVGELEEGQVPSTSLRGIAEKLDLRKHLDLSENPARVAFGDGAAPAPLEESPKPSAEPSLPVEESPKPSATPESSTHP